MSEIRIQHANAALGTVTMPSGQILYVFVTHEWRRPLEQLAALVNEQQATIEDLQTRLTALGG